MGALSPDRESAPMPQSPVRSYLHEPLDIHGNRFTQISFNHPIPLDDISNAHRFIFGQVFHFSRGIYLGFFANFDGPAMPDAINVGQTDPNFFIQRQVHSCNSSQFLPPLSLALLVLGIDTTNLDHPFTAHNLTFGAKFLDGRSYFHNQSAVGSRQSAVFNFIYRRPLLPVLPASPLHKVLLLLT
jgi:hypothetical protein